MYNYFFRLNTTKVLDFLAWYEALSIYNKYLSERDKSIPQHKDTTYTVVYERIKLIKNSMNKARVDFKLPESHKVTMTKEWLLGFIEGEGCFYVNNFSVNFILSQTAVNRYVLLHIKDYLMGICGDNMIITLIDCKPTKLKQNPYTTIYIGKGNHTAFIFISLLINLTWLSLKRLDFIYWVIIYILVYEGKHILGEGKDVIRELKAKMGIQCDISNLEISQETLALLSSESNYIESDQPGIWKVKINHKGLSSTIHKQGSYVLCTNPENNETLRFKSNAECSKYFEVTKTTIARWINKNIPILTKKGTFLFKKLYD